MALVAWVLGVLTSWLLFRDNVPWLVVLFNGLALLMNLSYASTSLVGYVGWFAFLGVFAAGSEATRQPHRTVAT